MQNGGDFMTAKEAAKRLGITPQTLHKWRKNGKGPAFVQHGSDTRPRFSYAPEDVDEWIRRQRRVPGDQG